MPELHKETFKKFYEKYSKSHKGKQRSNYGGISKPTRKTFFADNKRYGGKSTNKLTEKDGV